MNPKKICYRCFQEKEAGICPHCGYDDSEEHPFLALPRGTILNGRYMTGKVLGVGGFGITYLGYDLVLQIRVAIKEYMPSGMATRYKDGYTVTLTGRLEKEYNAGMERFLDEVRILAKLQNQPNIVSAQNYFKENGTAYFVMEYIEGMSLKEYLKDHGGKISCQEALSILLPIMEALCVVHSMNLIHRDISPDNIYLTNAGESRLLDFGAARFSMGDNKSVSVILKHGYAPEEQYSSRGNQGPWTDVYGMGATLYRCVTGILPPDSIERMHSDTLQKPSELGVDMPAPMEAAVLKALSVKAEDRFPNMQDFIDAIGGQPARPAGHSEAHAVGHTVARSAAEPATALPRRPEELSSFSGRRAFYQALRQADPVTRRRLIIGGVVGVAALALIFSLPGLLDGKSHSSYSGGGGGGSAIGSTEVTLPSLSSGSAGEQAPDAAATEPGDTGTPGQTAPATYDDLVTHELVGYGAQISLPGDWVEDPDIYMFTSPDSRISLGVDFYYYTSFAPCYTLNDIADHVEDAAALVADTMGLAPYEVASYTATTLNGAPAYQIDLSAISPNNTLVDVVLLFTQPQNGFGLYFVTGSCDANTAGAYDTLLQYLNTFTVTGPVDTEYKVFTDSSLDFRFVYSSDAIPQTPTVKPLTMNNGARLTIALLYPDAADTTQFLEVENITPMAATRDSGADYYYSLYQSVGAQLEEPYQDVWGGVEWTLWEGTLNEQSIACGIAEMDGQVYLAALAGEEEYWDVLADAMVSVMSTLRPKT